MSQSVRDNQWAEYKNEITSLYRKHTLLDVMQQMSEKHGFHASKNDYVKRLRLWGVKKNVKKNHAAGTWNYIDQQLKKRSLAGKKSNVSVNEKHYSHRRVQKEISRNVTQRDIFKRACEFLPRSFLFSLNAGFQNQN
ncbi:Clr5 domain-containing protein [Aspergillus falconensis]